MKAQITIPHAFINKIKENPAFLDTYLEHQTKAGIYAFVFNNKILYIGKSIDLEQRYALHKITLKTSQEKKYQILREVDFHFLPIYYCLSQTEEEIDKELKEREAFFINFYLPPLNTQIPRHPYFSEQQSLINTVNTLDAALACAKSLTFDYNFKLKTTSSKPQKIAHRITTEDEDFDPILLNTPILPQLELKQYTEEEIIAAIGYKAAYTKNTSQRLVHRLNDLGYKVKYKKHIFTILSAPTKICEQIKEILLKDLNLSTQFNFQIRIIVLAESFCNPNFLNLNSREERKEYLDNKYQTILSSQTIGRIMLQFVDLKLLQKTSVNHYKIPFPYIEKDKNKNIYQKLYYLCQQYYNQHLRKEQLNP